MLVSRICQKEGAESVVAPRSHGHFMCVMSTCGFISGVYCYRAGFYVLSASPFLTYASSINYWRYPVYGTRRNIDILFVTSSLALHSVLSLKIDNMKVHYLYLTPIVAALYSISWLFYKRKYYWSSTIAHGAIHVVANVMNILFYKALSEKYLR